MLVDEFRAYIRSLLGVALELATYVPRGLPFYLAELYDYRIANLHNRSLLFCFLRGDMIPAPAQLAEHEVRLRKAAGSEVVFVFPALDSRNRKRLIEARISFAVPGTQLYLPTLLIDLREQFAKARGKPELLSWPAQVLLIRWLIDPAIEGRAVRELSKLVGYSPISMSRALDELIDLELAGTNKGKTKPLIFGRSKVELWKAALPFLRTPVKERLTWPCLPAMKEWPLAGTTALSALTSLHGGGLECRAAARSDFHDKYPASVHKDFHEDGQSVELELWAYEPHCEFYPKTVDPFSLYLSLQTDGDERVQKALDGLLKGIL
ncbi:MAG: hypothetical protein M0Z80_00195 [Treponema sp.]|nr:hypothetical protein [Treponema sp.]